MISLLCLAAACLVGNIGVTSTLHSSDLKAPIVEFMAQNFDTFVNKYNEFHEDDLIATKLLRTRNLVLEEGAVGYYFDFDYGYMVASEEYEIYLVSNYDLSFEDNLFLTDDTLYFTGTAFYDGNGNEYGIASDYFSTDSNADFKVTTNLSATSSSSDRDGEITSSEIDGYTSTYYPGYNVVSENYIPFCDYVYQLDTSVYIKSSGGYEYSEANCVINSTYSMLHNLGKKDRDRDFYYSDYYVDYTGDNLINDAHYSLTYNGWKSNDRSRSGAPNLGKKALKVASDLYLRLRERAIISYGYNEETGMNGSYAKNMAMDVDGWYGYNTDFFETNDFNTVKSLVDSNIPSLVGTTGSINYGNHSMAVNGYIKLEKTSGWWIFTSTDTKWILAVDDGRQKSCTNGSESKRIFYDPNKKGGARFVCADKNTIDFSTC
jgi:hypothetical protein